MASFGISTNNQYISGYVEYSESDVSVVNNTSKVTMKAYLHRTNSWSGQQTSAGHVTAWFEIDGQNPGGLYLGSVTIPNNGDYVKVGEWGTTVAHNNDGSRKVKISYGLSNTYGTTGLQVSTTSQEIDLTTIPRQAEITSSSDFNDTQLPTVTYKNPLGNSAEEVVICIADYAAYEGYTSYRPVNKTGTLSYTFTKDDVNELKKRTNNTLDISFVLRTKISGNYFYSVAYHKFTMTENSDTKPSVSMSISLNNGSLSSAFDGLYIQGKSRVDVTLSGSGKYNASINSYSAVIDGKTYNSASFTSNAIQTSGIQNIVGYAKDSRGFTGSTTKNINVIEYSRPLVIPLSTENAIMCYRSDGNGRRVSNSTSVWIKAKRNYYTVTSDGTQKNFCSLQYRVKATDGSWSGWRDLISKSNLDTNEYNALIPDKVFNIKKAYTIQIRAIDDIGETDTKSFNIPTQDVALHLGKGGNVVSVGQYCDYSIPDSFQVNWDTYIQGTKIMPNVFYQASGSVDAVKDQSCDICSVTIKEIGYYLLLGVVDTSVKDSSSFVSASLVASGSYSNIYGRTTRTSMEAGGGTTTFGLISVQGENATVTLTSYGYSSQTYKLRGDLLAIRLDQNGE